MRVFITGSTGLLGSTVIRLAPKGIKIGGSVHINKLVPNVNCEYHNLDITKYNEVEKALTKFKPDVVIHTAAIATPDYCDKHQDEAYQVNVVGTQNVIKACKKVGSKLVYITTNGVYDGENAPYDESSIPAPIDYYGETKYEGEKLTQNSDLDYLLIRLITMFGWNNPQERQNPVTWLVEILGTNKTPVNMVTDMVNNFLFVEFAAKAIWKAIQRDKWRDSFNIAGQNNLSRYDFSVEIAEVFGLDKKMIFPVTLDFFKNFVARPKNTCFKTDKMEKELELEPLNSKKALIYMKNHPLNDSTWKEL
jgi:dTDP-4-dehydrorhamnose reductase